MAGVLGAYDKLQNLVLRRAPSAPAILISAGRTNHTLLGRIVALQNFDSDMYVPACLTVWFVMAGGLNGGTIKKLYKK